MDRETYQQEIQSVQISYWQTCWEVSSKTNGSASRAGTGGRVNSTQLLWQIHLISVPRDRSLPLRTNAYDSCDTPSQIRFWHQFLWLLCCCVSKLRQAVKDREAWRVTVHGITKTRTRLSDLNQPNPTAVITSTFNLASESGPPTPTLEAWATVLQTGLKFCHLQNCPRFQSQFKP